ncbi:MAG: hypothetical protein V2G41_09675 [bacterium JZ-2024 1]
MPQTIPLRRKTYISTDPELNSILSQMSPEKRMEILEQIPKEFLIEVDPTYTPDPEEVIKDKTTAARALDVLTSGIGGALQGLGAGPQGALVGAGAGALSSVISQALGSTPRMYDIQQIYNILPFLGKKPWTVAAQVGAQNLIREYATPDTPQDVKHRIGEVVAGAAIPATGVLGMGKAIEALEKSEASRILANKLREIQQLPKQHVQGSRIGLPEIVPPIKDERLPEQILIPRREPESIANLLSGIEKEIRLPRDNDIKAVVDRYGREFARQSGSPADVFLENRLRRLSRTGEGQVLKATGSSAEEASLRDAKAQELARNIMDTATSARHYAMAYAAVKDAILRNKQFIEETPSFYDHMRDQFIGKILSMEGGVKGPRGETLSNPDFFGHMIRTFGKDHVDKMIGKPGSYDELLKMSDAASRLGYLGKMHVRLSQDGVWFFKAAEGVISRLADRNISLSPRIGSEGKDILPAAGVGKAVIGGLLAGTALKGATDPLALAVAGAIGLGEWIHYSYRDFADKLVAGRGVKSARNAEKIVRMALSPSTKTFGGMSLEKFDPDRVFKFLEDNASNVFFGPPPGEPGTP